jgi:hypothetical protein
VPPRPHGRLDTQGLQLLGHSLLDVQDVQVRVVLGSRVLLRRHRFVVCLVPLDLLNTDSEFLVELLSLQDERPMEEGVREFVHIEALLFGTTADFFKPLHCRSPSSSRPTRHQHPARE